MTKHKRDAKGFITMIIMMVVILAVVVGFAYLRVKHAAK